MKSFAVIGLGRFGHRVAQGLVEHGAEVVAVDRNPKVVDAIKESVNLAITMDALEDSETLKEAGIADVECAIVSMGDSFEASQLATIHLKRLGVKTVIVKASTKVQAQILSLIGADQVIFPEVEVAERLAHSLIFNGLENYLKLYDNLSIIEYRVHKMLIDKTPVDANLRKRYDINIVAVRSQPTSDQDQSCVMLPNLDYTFKENDVLILVGSEANLQRFLADHGRTDS